MYLFTISDSVAQRAGNVFMLDTIGEAERQFHDALKNSQEGSLFRTHPYDFSLYLLGEFDVKTMAISNVQLTLLAAGSNVSDFSVSEPKVAA